NELSNKVSNFSTDQETGKVTMSGASLELYATGSQRTQLILRNNSGNNSNSFIKFDSDVVDYTIFEWSGGQNLTFTTNDGVDGGYKELFKIWRTGVVSVPGTLSTANLRLGQIGDYADNASAKAAGLTTNDVYRTGEILKIVY
ncbi:hypothetical protein N8455_00820, partial [Candidatus Gracilibacteria bacterium]|nr:hypothetical protein [Candidatus Gracilibacteria bacterium]